MDKERIIEMLKEINAGLTDEVLENATKEELEEYVKLSDEIMTKLEKLD